MRRYTGRIPESHEYNGDRFDIIFTANYQNLSFSFGVPVTHNNIPAGEVAFIYIVLRKQGVVQVLMLDQNEVLDFQLGLAFIMNQQLRGDVEVMRSQEQEQEVA